MMLCYAVLCYAVREGLRFTDFHAGASVCTPSRAALLTGRHGARTGVVNNFEADSNGGLPLNESTLAELLGARGYTSGMVGKWHLGMAHGHQPTARGFDSWVGLPYSSDMGCAARRTSVMAPDNAARTIFCPACQHGGDPPPSCPADNSCGRPVGCYDSVGATALGVPFFRNFTIVEQPADLDALSDRYAAAARAFVGGAVESGRPFFLYYAAAHVHVPQNHAARWANVSTSPFATRANGGAEFAAALAEMDGEVGAVMDALDEHHDRDGSNSQRASADASNSHTSDPATAHPVGRLTASARSQWS